MAGTDAQVSETPDAYLTALGASLAAQAGVDAELAIILAAHVVRAEPAKEVVAFALEAIRKLAAERAELSKAGTDRG